MLLLLRIALRKTCETTALTTGSRWRWRRRRRWRRRTRAPRCARNRVRQCCATNTRQSAGRGLEKQNIQMVIINESQFNAFVGSDGRRHLRELRAEWMQSETPNQIIGVWRTNRPFGRRHLAKMPNTAQAQDPDDHRHAARRRRDGRGREAGNSGLANAGAARSSVRRK